MQLSKSLRSDKVNLSSRVSLVEEEMQITIESYRSVLQQQPLPQNDDCCNTSIDREERESCEDIDLSTTDAGGAGTGRSAAMVNQTTTVQ